MLHLEVTSITKLDTVKFYNESWKLIYFLGQKAKIVEKHCQHGSLHSFECWLF